MKKRHPQNSNKGFTLVELIVSLGLFIVVVFIGVGALLSVVDVNRKAQAMRTAMDNLNLTMEEMSRELRMGTEYYCNPDLTTGAFILDSNDTMNVQSCDVNVGRSIAFLDQDGRTVIYQKNGNTIERSFDGGITFVPMTAPGITVDYLKFGVFIESGWAEYVVDQPSVLIAVGGTAGVKDALLSKFNLQTWVTQRVRKL